MNTILFVGEHARTFQVHWHEHAAWELVYCTGGEGEFRFEDGTRIPYRQGDAVAIPPRLRHANYSEPGFTNLHMTMEEPSFPFRDPFAVADDSEEHLKNAFREAKFYYISDIPRRDLLLGALGELISGYMMVYSDNDYSAPVARLRSIIIDRYAEPSFALDEAIASLPFHYDYVRKLFKKEVGQSPLEYTTGLRMKKAELMLASNWTRDYSVGEIAQLCGYENALYFSRVFRKHFGCSPSEYAEKSGKP
jgi:AraC-like DNA-binding protein